MSNNKIKTIIERSEGFQYNLIGEGIAVGVLTGLIISLFRLTLEKAEFLRNSALSIGLHGSIGLILLPALLVLSYGIVVLCMKMAPLCGGSGIPQVKGELKGQVEQKWYRILPAKFIGGIFTIGAGLSMGREGPSIQLGAMAGKGFSRLGKKLRTEEKMLMTCGAGAGLAAAFCAPLAGVVFALEELHKNFSTEVLLSTMAASVASDFIATYIFGLDPIFDLNVTGRLPLERYWMVILLGIFLGAFGVLYNKVTEVVQNLYDKIDRKSIRYLVPYIFLIPVVLLFPIVLGGGHSIVGQVSEGMFTWQFLLVLLLIKFVFSIICFGSGAPGGIFLPLLVLGAITGGLFSELISSVIGFEEYYVSNFVILGMTGYFASIVRAPITGVILITEMTGDFQNFLSLAVVSLVSVLIADILNGKPIYDQLLERMLSKSGDYGTTNETGNKKVLLDADVYIDSLMDGSKISEMLLPRGCLVVSVMRDGKEIVPHGDTMLSGGDKLTVLCKEAYLIEVQKKIDNICHRTRY